MYKKLALVCILFTGCAQFGNRQAVADCQSFGFTTGTPDYKTCIQRVSNSKEQFPSTIISSDTSLLYYKRTTTCNKKDGFMVCDVSYHK